MDILFCDQIRAKNWASVATWKLPQTNSFVNKNGDIYTQFK